MTTEPGVVMVVVYNSSFRIVVRVANGGVSEVRKGVRNWVMNGVMNGVRGEVIRGIMSGFGFGGC